MSLRSLKCLAKRSVVQGRVAHRPQACICELQESRWDRGQRSVVDRGRQSYYRATKKPPAYHSLREKGNACCQQTARQQDYDENASAWQINSNFDGLFLLFP